MRLKRDRRRLAGSTALIVPPVACWLTHLWVGFITIPAKDSGVYRNMPFWMERMGLDALRLGSLPSVLCGVCGLFIALWGLRVRSGYAVSAGIWACAAASIILGFYILATF